MNLDLAKLPRLEQNFSVLSQGIHINRFKDYELWADLEKNKDAYSALYKALGFDLAVDDRGFAWFRGVERSSSKTKRHRQLALFFLFLFEEMANRGKSIENLTNFENTSWFDPTIPAVFVYYAGNIPKMVLEALGKQLISENIVIFPDYDATGLRNYLNLKKYSQGKITLFEMKDWQRILSTYGSDNLYQKDMNKLHRACQEILLTEDGFARELALALLSTGNALEQEASYL